MSKKNFLSGKDKELYEMAERFEKAQEEGSLIYLDADDWADLADWYAIHKKDQLALLAADQGLYQHPQNTALLVEKAYLYIDNNQRQKAEAVCESIEETYLPEVKILQANLLFEKVQVDEAERLLHTIQEMDDLPNIVEIIYLFIEVGYPERALPYLEKGKSLFADKEAFLAVSADYYNAIGDKDKSAEIFNQLIDINPYSAPYWFGLSRYYLEKEMYNQAIEAADFAIIADEEFPEAYLIRGSAFLQLGNEEKASENFKIGAELGAIPKLYDETYQAMLLLSNEEWDKAIEAYEKILPHIDEASLPAPFIYAQLATAHMYAGHYDEAHTYCQKGYEEDPQDPSCYVIEGRVHAFEGDTQKALDTWNKVFELTNDIVTWWEIGCMALDANILKLSLDCFLKIEAEQPDFTNLNEQLAVVYLLLNDKESFLKYNQRCKHPIQPEKVEEIYRVMEECGQEELASTLKEILDTFK